ncbi:MAG: hypothetical protein WC919_06600 [Candidatus Paceibacterota bacterium]|jgi:hypothetical protein
MSEDFKPREQVEDTEAECVEMTDDDAHHDKLKTSIIYNVMDFYECALAHTLGTRRFSTHTEEGIPIQSSCIAHDACDSKPHMVVMLHYDAQLLRDIIGTFDGMILILGSHPSERDIEHERARVRIMFVNMMQFMRCAPIRSEHSALEIFHYISTEMAYMQESTSTSTGASICTSTSTSTSTRTPQQLDAHNFVLGLRLLSETTSIAHIIDGIIADWRRAMDPSEMVALGHAHSIQIQSMIRARSDLARIMNIDIARTQTTPLLIEVKMFLCQDLVDHAHSICAGQSDVIMTYSVRSSNLDYVLTCSGDHAREVINIAIDGESESNLIIEGVTSSNDVRIQTWTARATHEQMCAFVRETTRA